ncbi:MAG: DUF4340 domain-containing protein [bacterium]|nr:DUF4340 domain-containing protein [bacterium]
MKKSTTILVALFILLLAVFYLETLKEKKGSREELGPILEIEKDQITGVEITRDKEKVVLAKQEGEWRISDPVKYRANQAYVEDLFGNIFSLEREALISESPEKQALFEVDTAGIIVKVSGGDKSLSSFIIGKQSPDYTHTYLRPTDSNGIYLVKGVARWHYTRRAKDWRDKTIFDFDPAAVKEIALSETDSVTKLWKKREIWKMESKGEESLADTKAITQLLSAASSLQTNDFKDTAPGRNFSQPDFRLKIGFDSGETTGLSLLAENEQKNRYLARKDGEETIFMVYKGSLSAIMKKVEDLKAKE